MREIGVGDLLHRTDTALNISVADIFPQYLELELLMVLYIHEVQEIDIPLLLGFAPIKHENSYAFRCRKATMLQRNH
jgi:hypothetical protein